MNSETVKINRMDNIRRPTRCSVEVSVVMGVDAQSHNALWWIDVITFYCQHEERSKGCCGKRSSFDCSFFKIYIENMQPILSGPAIRPRWRSFHANIHYLRQPKPFHVRVYYACVFHESLPIFIIHKWNPLRVLPRFRNMLAHLLVMCCRESLSIPYHSQETNGRRDGRETEIKKNS